MFLNITRLSYYTNQCFQIVYNHYNVKSKTQLITMCETWLKPLLCCVSLSLNGPQKVSPCFFHSENLNSNVNLCFKIVAAETLIIQVSRNHLKRNHLKRFKHASKKKMFNDIMQLTYTFISQFNCFYLTTQAITSSLKHQFVESFYGYNFNFKPFK